MAGDVAASVGQWWTMVNIGQSWEAVLWKTPESFEIDETMDSGCGIFVVARKFQSAAQMLADLLVLSVCWFVGHLRATAGFTT